MGETEDNVMMEPSSLCLDDLMELKYSALDDSIQLIPLDANFATFVANNTDKEKTDEEQMKETLEVCEAARITSLTNPILGLDGRYSCPLCDKTFAQKHIVPRHIRAKHENFYDQCRECGQLVRNLKQHLRFRHSGRQTVNCVICGLEKESKRDLRYHLASDHGDICVPAGEAAIPRSCPTCGVTLHSKKSLWQCHIYPQHMVPRRYFTCPLPSCPRTVSKLDDDHSLKLHLTNHHGHNVDKVHHCHLCPQKMLDSSLLSDHLTYNHNGLDYVKCPLCDEHFSKYQLMALHVYQEHNAIFRGWVGCDRPEVEFTPHNPSIQKALDLDFTSSAKSENSEDKSKSPLEKHFDISDLEEVIKKPEECFQINDDLTADDKIVKSPPLTELTLPRGTRVVKETETEILLEVEDNIELENPEDTVDKIVIGDFIKVNSGKADGAREDIFLDNQQESNILQNNDISQVNCDIISTDLSSSLVDSNNYTHLNTSIDSDGHEIVLESVRVDDQLVQRRSTNNGTYSCSWSGCSKTFVARHSVAVHVRAVHLSPSGGIPCNQCGKRYRTEDTLKLHKKTVHDAVAACCTWPGCGKMLVSNRQMRSHLLKHSEQPQPCHIVGCDSVLKNSNVFRMHLKKIHGKMSEQVSTNPKERLSNKIMPTITTYKLR